MDLWWDEEERWGNLYVGCWNQSVASIWPSSSGKQWTYLIELPGVGLQWKKYLPRDELKITIEKGVEDFFGLANTWRPAMDKPDEP